MNAMDINKFEMLKASGSLPSPKGVALAIMRLTQKEDASMAELARIIKSDPAFVGRLIKAANSVNANPGRPVVSVQEALVVLGMPAVRNLALGFSLLSQYKTGVCKGFDYHRYWAASLACGIALQAVTLRTRLAQPEETFSVGLLARVGELALATVYPEEYGRILRAAVKNPSADLTPLEMDAFALDHRELTAAMLAEWGLPRIYCDVAHGHEQCDEPRFSEASRESKLLQSLAVARHIAGICVAEAAGRAGLMPRLFEIAARIGIEDEEALVHLCDSIVREWREWSSILSIAASKVPPFAELVKAQPPAEPAPAQGRLRVLVADDEDRNRSSVRAILDEAGYEVSEAADGEEGLRIALESQPHILVVDRRLPGLDGLALTQSLRKTRLGRSMYILMLAQPGENESLVEGFDAGVDDYLFTPLDRRLLVARLRAGERIVRLHQELERDKEELHRFAAELSVSNRRLKEAALTDVLTGSPNRRYAMERIQQEWAASERNKRSLACMVIDLDEFKTINDAYGHDVGDAYLKQTAATIRSALRAQDVVCRTGGDEFLVICPDTGLQSALVCAERIRAAVEQASIMAGQLRLKASLSIGVAARLESMANPDALMKCADEGAYLAKQRGRNRVATTHSGLTS